jgi:hypothetical protein
MIDVVLRRASERGGTIFENRDIRNMVDSRRPPRV